MHFSEFIRLIMSCHCFYAYRKYGKCSYFCTHMETNALYSFNIYLSRYVWIENLQKIACHMTEFFFLFLNNCTFILVHINYTIHVSAVLKIKNWTVKIFRNYICSYFSWLIFSIFIYLAKSPKSHLLTYVVLRLKL